MAASRMLLRLGGGMARSARGRDLLFPAGQLRAPLPAGALGRPGTMFSARQSRYISDTSKSTMEEFTAKIQALEQAGILFDQRLEQLERRAEAAERKAEAAESRAELAEKRYYIAEKHVEMLGGYAQAQESKTHMLEHNMFVAFNRISKIGQDCQANFFVSLHLHWILAAEVARQRESLSELKTDYKNAVRDSKNAVSATSWRIILTLMSGFGAVTVFYLPYVVSNIKQELRDEVKKMMAEKLDPILNKVQKNENMNTKSRKWWNW